MTKIRIRLTGEDYKTLDNVVSQIRELSIALGMKLIGPIPVPARRLQITTRRTPCGDGSDTYEHWEKRVSKRLVDVEGDEKFIKQILHVKVPTNVYVKISLS